MDLISLKFSVKIKAKFSKKSTKIKLMQCNNKFFGQDFDCGQRLEYAA